MATPYSTRPPRMEYSLTGDGRDLASALRLLADWGSRRGELGEPLRHDRCGTPLEARWYCPTCASAVSDAETDERRDAPALDARCPSGAGRRPISVRLVIREYAERSART